MTKNTDSKYSYKECKVLSYIKHMSLLTVNFDGVGISFDSDYVGNETVKVKYTGKIGTKNFKCELAR